MRTQLRNHSPCPWSRLNHPRHRLPPDGRPCLAVRNPFLITGDPPKVGKLPHATPVSDVDRIGLLEIVQGLNVGIDPAGGAMDSPTRFLCGVGVEPAAAESD